MEISVITAVYNRETTLAESMCSLNRQSHPFIQHVVQDGASTDDSINIIRAFKTGDQDLVSEPDHGLYDALNRGLRRARGDVIGFLHSDDVFADADVLRDVAQVLADPAIDGVYGDLDYVAQNDATRVLRHWVAGEYHPNRLSWGWMPPHPTLFLKRSVYENFGSFDAQFSISADYDAMLRFMMGGVRLAYIPRVLVRMRTGGASNKSFKHLLCKMVEDHRVINRNGLHGMATLFSKNIRKIIQFRI